jgi:streptogramin lyase
VQRKRLTSMKHSQQFWSENGLVVDRRNIMWSCSEFGGLLAYDLDDTTWTHYAKIDTHPSAKIEYAGLKLDSSGHLWALGYSSTLVKFSHGGMVEKVYPLPDLQGQQIDLLCAAPDGGIWLSFREEYTTPVYTCRIRNDSVTIFDSPRDPFFSDVKNATVDTAGNVWFCTNRGIVVFNPEGIADRPELPARKEYGQGPQGINSLPFRLLRNGGMTALGINLPEPARVEYAIFDSRGRTVVAREAGRLPLGEHRWPIGGNQLEQWAGAVLFVRVRVTAMTGESITHTLRYTHRSP